MNQDQQEILQLIERYKTAIHTQRGEDFLPLWSETCQTSLISLSTCYSGTESIYQDFLVGRIHKAYSSIRLLTKEVQVRMISHTCAMAIFSYSTQCIRRETGEPYGIEGLETQVFVKEEKGWRLVHIQYAKA